MSKIQDMIDQICPEGVEYARLIDRASVKYGYPFDSSLFTEDDSFIPLIRIRDVKPGFSGTFYKGVILPEYIIRKGDILVGMDGEFNLGKWNDRDALLNQRVCKISSNDESIVLNGFLEYYLGPVFKSIEDEIPGSTVKHLSAKRINGIEIPVPPIEVQREIVKVLDSFSKHTAALVAELDAELAARKKQYDYYKETLLADAEDFEYAPLDSICNKIENIKWKVYEGTREYIDLSSVDRQIHSILQTITIDKETAPSRAQQIIHTNDVLFGTTRPTLMRFCLVDRRFDNQICSTGFCVLRPNEFVCSRWLYYQISSKRFYDYVEDHQLGAGYPSISDTLVKSFKIPLPPILEQERIITILDKFEEQTSTLCSELSAEIKARQQQYIFYRDQLLTFKRAN